MIPLSTYYASAAAEWQMKGKLILAEECRAIAKRLAEQEKLDKHKKSKKEKK